MATTKRSGVDASAASKGKRRPKDADFEPILELMIEGISLRETCRQLGLHVQSTNAWLLDPARRGQYTRAQELSGEAHVDGVKQVVAKLLKGEITPDVARVAIDAGKWIAGRQAPKAPPAQRLNVHHYDNLSDEEIERKLAAYRAGEIPDDECDDGDSLH